jgi:alkanesulfonate monooxygenase SsuD/methylene tetrahydromethanopterin reductase-like flavin-dependent oxidoreductase (luciferase family)
MKIGLFYELQTPRPWTDASEHDTIQEALAQIELADEIGIDYVWAVEHHFLEEYCHCSAPEVFLAAASQRTKRIRIGHGIVLAAPQINHPARIAERISMLDHVSNGRVEFGTGEGTSDIELDGFHLSRDDKNAAWREGLSAVIGMMTEPIFGGVEGKYANFPRRSVVPKPYQKPHPPLWVACNRREKIIEAARLGLGALNFSFGVKPELASRYAQAYYGRLAEGIEPIGKAVNANLAVVTGFSCTESAQDARDAFQAMKFFMHAINFYFEPGRKMPDQVDLGGTFGDGSQVTGFDQDDPASLGIFGNPDTARRGLAAYEASGVDQVILVAQMGGYAHERIVDSLRLFGREVLPEFKARDVAAQREKDERLAMLNLAVGAPAVPL